MRLRKIIINDFMRLRGIHVIPVGDLTLVTGANASGKSTIMRAIRWALTGGHDRQIEDDLISVGQPECSVTLELDEPDARVSRTRRRGKDSNVELVYDGVTSTQRTARAKLLEILGVDSDKEYTRLTHVAQGSATSLADAANAERREILMGWVAADMDRWVAAREQVKRNSREARASLSKVEGALEQVQAALDASPEDEGDLDAELAVAQSRLDEGRLVEKRWRTEQMSKGKREAAMERLEKLTTRLSALEERAPAATPSEDPELAGYVSALKERLASAKEERSKLSTIIANGFSGECPITGEECGARESVEGSIGAVAAKVAELDRARQEMVTELKPLIQRQRDIEAALSEERARQEEISRLTEETTELRSSLLIGTSHVAPEPPCIEELLREVQSIKERQRRACERSEMIARAADLQREIDSRRLDLSAATALGQAMDSVPGPAGAAVAEIEDAANDLLSESGLRVELRWTRETSRLESECACGHVYRTKSKPECPECGSPRRAAEVPDLQILVSDGSASTSDVRYESGGRRQLVCLAMRLVAATHSTPRWIVLDEVDGALDPVNRAAAMRLVERAADQFGLQPLIVTQHEDAAQVVSASVVKVTLGDDGWSAIYSIIV